MPRLLPALLLVALAPACDPPKTVKALRYSIVYVESGCDLAHGGGRWVQEIFFPDLKVTCMLVFEWREPGAGKGAEPRLYAFPAEKPRNDLTGLHEAKPSAIEEIEVPAEFAEEVRKLADLTKRWEGETWRLGQAVAATKLLKELPQD